MTVVTIHQPEHMPWSGFFHKMAQADRYVLLDSVQFKKNNWQNRNRIVDRQGKEQWLTVPVQMKGHINSTIAETEIQNNQPWQRKYWGRLHDAYCKYPFYKEYAPALKEIIYAGHTHLIDLNMELIDFFLEKFSITTPLVRSSTLDVSGKSTALLVSICKAMKADTYIAGSDGANYMDMSLFKAARINIVFHVFSPPVYDAKHYLSALSVLDVLMTHGDKAVDIIGLT